MPPEPPITTEATIIEVLNDHTCTARLPNGKTVHAHVPKRAEKAYELERGAEVTLELTPYDFSKARIQTTPPTQETK